MGALKVIYLINLLGKMTRGKDAELARLYAQALQDVPEYQKLQTLLEDYYFSADPGRSLERKVQELLRLANEEPAMAAETFQVIRQVNNLIQQKAAACRGLIESPAVFTEPLTVLEKRKIPDYRSFFEQVAAACTWLIALYEGESGLARLSWTDNGSLADQVRLVNQVFLPSLCRISVPVRSWLITRRRLGGRNLFAGSFFAIRYLTPQALAALTGGLKAERQTPYLFFNPDAASAFVYDVPWCWGSGHILSIKPADSLRLFSSKLTVKPAAPLPDDLLMPPPDPLSCLSRLTGEATYCISPDDLVSALNEWQMGHDIQLLRTNHRCLFCGRTVSAGQLVCPSHFSIKGV